MKKILLVMLLMASPLWAQSQLAPKPAPKSTARAADGCAPIGRTARGELVYSMKCDNLPVPPPAQAEVRDAPVAAPSPEPEPRGGLFGWSYDRRPKE
ncbi:MAG: hypothetical protein ACREEK_01065 [Bradyrhizobium sp.]